MLALGLVVVEVVEVSIFKSAFVALCNGANLYHSDLSAHFQVPNLWIEGNSEWKKQLHGRYGSSSSVTKSMPRQYVILQFNPLVKNI